MLIAKITGFTPTSHQYTPPLQNSKQNRIHVLLVHYLDAYLGQNVCTDDIQLAIHTLKNLITSSISLVSIIYTFEHKHVKWWRHHIFSSCYTTGVRSYSWPKISTFFCYWSSDCRTYKPFIISIHIGIISNVPFISPLLFTITPALSITQIMIWSH